MVAKHYPSLEEKRQSARDRLEKQSSVFGPKARYTFIPNNMAAGPCRHCLNAATQTYLLPDLPIAPLPGCPHPDQCVSYSKVELDLDEFEEGTTFELPPGMGLGSR